MLKFYLILKESCIFFQKGFKYVEIQIDPQRILQLIQKAEVHLKSLLFGLHEMDSLLNATIPKHFGKIMFYR